MTTSRLRESQLAGINQTIRLAADKVHYYREAFLKSKLPFPLRSLEDLQYAPFLDKKIIKDHYPFGLHTVKQDQMARIHSSSGSWGLPTVAGYTKNDVAMWTTLMERCLKVAGVNPGDTVQIAYGYGLFTGGLGCHSGSEKLGCLTIPASGGQTRRQVQLIRDLKPRVIMCTPSYLMTIGDELEEQGINPASTSLRIGILGAEPWSDEMRSQIEKRFKIDALDIYGLSEVIGPGVANESIHEKDGSYIWEDHFYPEIIDPVTLKVLPDGETGELVITTIGKEAFPMIRYRTGDLTKLIPSNNSPFRKIGRIIGRTDDMIILRGMKVYPLQLEKIICRSTLLSPHYYIYLSKKHHLDVMTLHVEVTPSDSVELITLKKETAEKWLKLEVKRTLGITVEVIVRHPQSLERIQTGKAKRVIDQRKPV
jgi:phenylacetate-CoA ligase